MDSGTARQADPLRFALITNARSGSTMLIQALNSHPDVRCLGAVFNQLVNFIDYDVEGYDGENRDDLRLRDREPVRFMRERVLGPPPDDARAVGFKYRYGQGEAFPGLLDAIQEDKDLHILHLKRRNRLRSLVSAKIVEATGVWFAETPPTLTARIARKATLANAKLALGHPMRALGGLRRAIAPPPPPWHVPGRPKVTLSVAECRAHFEAVERHERYFDEALVDHPKLDLLYRDLAADPDRALEPVHNFLGVEHRPPRISLRQQNPEPLRDLIENYDELRASFEGTPEAALFDD